ncbi:pre-rRNA 2'-O-ribose RNA methyltransferase FTSJ3 [Strongylocentrotus purpuratus]|uniref:Putative rRNA methyltransferase n=1 Tax=Strongylocentrotus purpuratus TaxID=7668 RepID=A0A7M7PBH6_STRPU|nr:pre-rRNA 2'-O-ribose RNA methyltransferase FTSJ3 [Strongylocentrotus purpuratus]
MGKKAKIGKQRKDRYYHLAKETGYRSRSAFKLIQLNRKFSFLQESRVCIDLCAAPGGWLQVASRNMPISSMIIGVDLFPIKPIPNVVSFTCDITTTKCRMQLRKEMKTWKADCVLHDGAPNVGTSWVLDAFTQAQLTLHALKLAVEFLNKGGWFITKVFRSKDYQPLLWVFHQMFRKVHVTKPQASRNESAEIFVVCQGFISPDKIDPKFFDPKYIFKEVVGEETTKQKATILRDPSKVKKAKAEGYAEGDYTLYHPVQVSKYMASEDALELLNNCSELVFDDDSIASHHLTTKEIKICCRDIKVLGRREVRDLLNWHKKYNKEKAQLEEETANQVKEKSKLEGKDEDGESEEDEDDVVAKQLATIKEEERLAGKRKKKDALKKRKKLRERLHKSKELQSNMGDDTQGESLFGLVNIKNAQQLQKVNTDDAGTVANDNDGPPEKQKKQLPSLKPAKTPAVIDQEEELEEGEEEEEDDDDDGSLIDSDLEEDEANALRAEIDRVSGRYDSESDKGSDDMYSDDDDETGNPLMVDLEKMDPEESAKRRTKLWFKKGVFNGLDEEDDEDVEIQQASKSYKQQGGAVLEKKEGSKAMEAEPKSKRSVSFKSTVTSLGDSGDEEEDDLSSESDDEGETRTKQNGLKKKGPGSGPTGGVGSRSRPDEYDSDSDSSDSDYEEESMMRREMDGGEMNEKTNGVNEGKSKKRKMEDSEDKKEAAPAKKSAKIKQHLDPEGLALGTMMATSKKATRQIIEHAYHRYSYGDQDRIPDWLRSDETRHCRRNTPVTKELVAEYRARLREVNARPIKKVAEAKARKKKKQIVKLEKLRKKAEVISDLVDTSETEKMSQMKNLYKKMKIGQTKKKDVKYVVTRKHQSTKRVSRPSGVKGPFKVVDPRMKKDMRGQKRAEARKKRDKKKR